MKITNKCIDIDYFKATIVDDSEIRIKKKTFGNKWQNRKCCTWLVNDKQKEAKIKHTIFQYSHMAIIAHDLNAVDMVDLKRF